MKVKLGGNVQKKLSVGKVHIYAGASAGHLIAFDKKDGSITGTFDSGESEIGSRQFFSLVY